MINQRNFTVQVILLKIPEVGDRQLWISFTSGFSLAQICKEIERCMARDSDILFNSFCITVYLTEYFSTSSVYDCKSCMYT